MNRPTSTQPQVNSMPIYSSKKLPTIKVKLKSSDKKMIISASDFDPEKYERLS